MQKVRLLRWVAVLFAVLTVSALVVLAQAPANAVAETIFGSTVPGVVNTSDSASVELGTRFYSTVAGNVTGVRFYKGNKNVGTHIGTLWSNTGAKLASVTFTNETASGWQIANFTTAIAIKANTNYVISYHDPKGFYSSNDNYFTGNTVTNGDLVAPKNAIGAPNGVYHYGTGVTFPKDTWKASNYWVDVVFQAGSVTPPTTTTTTVTTTIPTTTTPSVTTTVPTTTTTNSGIPVDFPTKDNTGSSGALTDVFPPNGELIIGDDNTVLENVLVHGTITVDSCNVTIRNVEVDTSSLTTKPGDNVFGLWLREDPKASCAPTVDHVTVTSPAGQYVTEAARIARGGPATVTAVKFVGQQLGMTVGSGTLVKDSYIELAPEFGGDHNEAILEDGINGLTIEHNTMLNPNSQTSVLSLFTEFGPNSNITVDGNFMAGGGYTCYCGDGVSDNLGNPTPASNVDFTNNVFSRKYFDSVGFVAPGRAYRSDGGGEWNNNVFANADGTVTTEIVPQPQVDGQ